MLRMTITSASLLVLVLGVPAQAAPKASEVPPLINKLKDKDAKVRAMAAKELFDIAAVKVSWVKPAIPALLEALKDDDTNVRREAARALGVVKPDAKEGVPALQGLLKDKDNGVRTAAADSLATYGKEAAEALPALMELQKELNDMKEEDKNKMRDLMQSVNDSIRSIQGMKKK